MMPAELPPPYWRSLVALTEASSDYITVCDSEGRVAYANPRMKAMRALQDQPDWPVLQERAFPAALKHTSWRGEGRLHPAVEGEIIETDIVVTVLEKDPSPCFAIVQRDIGDRKRFEEALRQSNEELQQFAYVVSHDLQEPLRTIASYAQFLARRFAGTLGGEADEFIGYIVGGVRRMSSLIDGVLTLSRLGYASQAPFTKVDMEEAFTLACQDLQAAIQEGKAEVTHDPLPTVKGDRSQLTQLLLNLIGNAIKYRRDEEPPRIHLSADKRANQWVFCLSDNGIGFDPSYAERVFGVFQRLHGVSYPGTGIGLALCKKIVERHGGRIWVESDVGRGSDFYFFLPAGN